MCFDACCVEDVAIYGSRASADSWCVVGIDCDAKPVAIYGVCGQLAYYVRNRIHIDTMHNCGRHAQLVHLGNIIVSG